MGYIPIDIPKLYIRVNGPTIAKIEGNHRLGTIEIDIKGQK